MSLLRFLGIGGDRTALQNQPDSLREIESRLEAMPAEEARFIAAFAYLLARIAGVDLKTENVEREAIAQRLETFAEVDPDRSRLLTEAAVHAASSYSATDDHLVARAFRDISDPPERIRLLRCLYAVAAADDNISTREDNVVFDIARTIGVDRDDVIGLRSQYKEILGSMKPLSGER